MTDPDTAAHARYYEHWQPGWPVVDGWEHSGYGGDLDHLEDGQSFKNKYPNGTFVRWEYLCGDYGFPPCEAQPIDIQALTGVLVGELLSPSVKPEKTRHGGDCPYVVRVGTEGGVFGKTLLDALVNAWIALHPHKEST